MSFLADADEGYAKFMAAENWTGDREGLLTYLHHDGQRVFHMTLNFPLLPALARLDAPLARESWEWDAALPPSAWLGNFASNHDLAADRPGTLFAEEPEKLRAATAWLLLAPGPPFLYYGNEIAQPRGPSAVTRATASRSIGRRSTASRTTPTRSGAGTSG